MVGDSAHPVHGQQSDDDERDAYGREKKGTDIPDTASEGDAQTHNAHVRNLSPDPIIGGYTATGYLTFDSWRVGWYRRLWLPNQIEMPRSLMNGSGLIRCPFRHTSKCKWQPRDNPEFPSRATNWPAATCCP